MTNAAINIRVSTRNQAEQGYGLDAQLAHCREYITRQGYTLIGEPYIDVITGTTSERPGLEALLEAIPRDSIAVVVMPEIDRVTRQGIADFVLIKGLIADSGACVEYAIGPNFDDSDDGEFTEHLMALLSARERKRILRKTRDGIAAKVSSGQVFASHPPYGYRLVSTRDAHGKLHNTLAIHDEEKQIIILIFTWYTIGDGEHGPMAANAIATRLTEMGMLS